MISDREFYNFIHSASGWTRALLARCLFNQPGMATFTFPTPSVSAPFLAYISRLVLSTLVLIHLFVIGPSSAIVSVIPFWSENCLCVHLTKPGFNTVSSLASVRLLLLYSTSQHRVCSTSQHNTGSCSTSQHISASALLLLTSPPLLYTMTPLVPSYPFVPPTPGCYKQVRWHTFPMTRRLRGQVRAHHQALRELVRSASTLAGPSSDYTYSELIQAASNSSIASAMGCLHLIWEEEHNVRTIFLCFLES